MNHAHRLAHQSLRRASSSSFQKWGTIPTLPNDSLPTFRTHAFELSKPFLLPKGSLASIPAIQKWFTPSSSAAPLPLTLNQDYLKQYGDTMLPLEYTVNDPQSPSSTFQRGSAPLALFLSWVAIATAPASADSSQPATGSRLYLAQAPLAALPAALHTDLPIPEYVAKAGKGDIYESNLWIGVPPTYTPLHKDPNPNLFAQLAGCKRVRLLEPGAGDRVFDRAKLGLRQNSGDRPSQDSKTFRGEEMMKGEERRLLEHMVWNTQETSSGYEGLEAELKTGDGIFIPQGWWHSIRGIGDGVTASVNWWFR